MRLSRTFLALAATLAGPLSAGNVTVDADLTLDSSADLVDLGGRVNNFAVGNGAILTIDLRNSLGAPIDATFGGRFLDGSFSADALVPGLDGSGTLLKTGGGTLQYNGFANMVYLGNASFDTALESPVPADLRPLLDNPGGLPVINQINAGAGQAFSGILIIQEGQLQVSGHINQWADYGDFNVALNATAGGVATMHGTRATVVENGAKLSFRNTTRNLVGASVSVGNPDSTPKTPLIGRLNYVQNILGTTASRLETGPDADYFLVIHSDIEGAGLDPGVVTETTVGILEGKGRVYKTGASDLRITNSSTFDGEFVAAGGRVILSAGSGDTLWSAASVNLASGGNGTNVAYAADIDWKPGYAPAASATTLVVQGAQRIRNFQSLYQDAGFPALIQPGTGGGNLVELASATDVLTVQHDAGFDGYFTGSVVGALDEDTGLRGEALGVLRKTGAGALALFSVGNNMSRLEILGGRIVSNVQSLGSGEVFVGNAGQLSIVQNDAGALRAVIRTETTDRDAELRFKPTDSIQYRGGNGAGLGNADAGVADIVVSQEFFYGRVIVEDGNAIVFSAGNNNAFLNSSTVELLEGASGRETSIRFNDTNQVINNLVGADSTRIYLGRGDITLNASVAGSYAGIVSGVGNFIKQGAGAYALSGPNTYFGATVVRQGLLTASAASAIGNTSGLVVLAPAVPGATPPATRFVASGAQSMGALFGQAGSSVAVSGALTVGVSDDLRARLVTALASIPGQFSERSAFYFATDTTQVIDGFAFTPATSIIYVVRQYGLADADLDGSTTDAEVRTYLGLAPDADLLDLDEADAAAILAGHRDLLAFAGSLTLGGSLTKVGAERLNLAGTVTFTGADRRVIVDGGTLEASFGTLAGAASIALGAAGTHELLVVDDRTLATPLSGAGTFRKTGAGKLTIDRPGASAFDGLYDVAEGDLEVVFRASSTPGLAREGSAAIAAGSTFVARVATDLFWQGEVYGDGDFVKTGAGALTLTEGLLFTEGLVRVEAGTLVAGAAPAGDLEILAGATFVSDNALEDDFYDGVLSGAGTLVKRGAFDLRLEVAAPGFTGTVDVEAGSLSLWESDALAAAGSVSLGAGTTLFILDGTTQSLANVTADPTAVVEIVDLGPGIGTTLTLDIAAGTTSPFSSRILGFPDLVKTGAGKLSFIRPADSPNEISTIDIQAGELEASQAGLGGADISLGAAGTLRFFADTGVTDSYPGLVLTGSGFVAKSGAGTVDLTGADLSTVSSSFDISGGTLVLSRDALGARLPTATLSGGATLAFETDADVTLSASGISGTGNLELRGAFTVDLTLGADGSPGYDGATRLADGVTVRLGSPTGSAALGGLETESGTTLDTALLTELELELDGETDFAGSLAGSADLVLGGDGTLDFTGGDTAGNLGAYLGDVRVDGAAAVLSTGNTKGIELVNSGRLVLTGAASAAYTAALTGDGTGIVALGAGASIDLVANPATSLDDGLVAKVELLAGSTLVLGLGSASLDKVADLSLSGGTLDLRLTEATGSLALVAPLAGTSGGAVNLTSAIGPASVNLTGSLAGDLGVGTGVTASLGTSSTPVSIGGDVLVNGTLSGSATIGGTLTVGAAGAVTPGFSPETIVVADLVNSGLLVMELGASAHDKILFSGTASLNEGGTGVLRLVRLPVPPPSPPPPLFGRRFDILVDTASPGPGSLVDDGSGARFDDIVSPTADAMRTLVFYPEALAEHPDLAIPGLAKDGEVAVYVVRSDAEYAVLLAGNPYLSRIQDAARVDLVADILDGTLSRSVPDEPNFNPYGARLAVLGDAALLVAVDNLRPRGQAALLAGAAAGFRSHADTLQRRLEQRRFDGADMSVKNDDWFVDATQGQVDLDNAHEARTTGATAGLIRPLGVDGYWAVSLGVETLRADGGSSDYKGNGFRLGGAVGVMNASRTLSVDAGLSYGKLGGDLSRGTLLGTDNVTDPQASTLGLWVRVSSATSVGPVALTPYLALEHSKTSLDRTKEAGFDLDDDFGDAMSFGGADHTQTAARAGLGMHRSWVSAGGDWRYRLGLEIAYALQLDGDDATLVSEHAQLGGGEVPSTFGVLPGDGFSVAPTFSFGASPDSTFTLGLRLEQGSEGDATSLQLGYRRKF